MRGKKETCMTSVVIIPNCSIIQEETKLIETPDGGYLRRSLQELSVQANMNYLLNELQRLKKQKKTNQQKIKKCKGLLELFKLLDVVECPKSFQKHLKTTVDISHFSTTHQRVNWNFATFCFIRWTDSQYTKCSSLMIVTSLLFALMVVITLSLCSAGYF